MPAAKPRRNAVSVIVTPPSTCTLQRGRQFLFVARTRIIVPLQLDMDARSGPHVVRRDNFNRLMLLQDRHGNLREISPAIRMEIIGI